MSAVPGGITGVTLQQAKNTLSSAGFSSVTQVCSNPALTNPHPTDQVTSSNPASGTIWKRSNTITLTVTCPPPTP